MAVILETATAHGPVEFLSSLVGFSVRPVQSVTRVNKGGSVRVIDMGENIFEQQGWQAGGLGRR